MKTVVTLNLNYQRDIKPYIPLQPKDIQTDCRINRLIFFSFSGTILTDMRMDQGEESGH